MTANEPSIVLMMTVMPRRALGGFLVALLLICASPALAQETRQFGGVVYPTQGWSPAAFETFAGLNAPESGARYLVLPSEATGAPLGDWLRTAAARFHEADRYAIQNETPSAFPDVLGFPATALFVRARPSYGRTRYGFFVGVRKDGRNYAVALQTRGEDELRQHTDGFAQWLEALRFEGDGTAALAPTPGPLGGTYAGLRLTFGAMPTHEVGFYTFSREGWVYDGVPDSASAATFDFRAAAASDPGDVGTYRVEGSEVALTFADGDAEQLEMKRTGDDLELDGFHFTHLPPLPSGTALDGRYRFGSYTTTDNTVSGGPLVASSFERDYRFTPDGRFETVAASFASATNASYVAAAGGQEAPVAGRYVVRGGLLVLTADDGTVMQKSIFRFGEDGLIIAGEPYYQR